jgi:hypothetical protein
MPAHQKPKPIWRIKLITKDFTSFISIDLQMSWATIYIKGREGFEKEVLHKLERSGFSFLSGSEDVEKGVSLYWINDQSSLRSFKKAITAKVIFQYRLQFFNSVEDLHQSNSVNIKLTPKEEALVKKMSDWQMAYNRELRNSA